MAQVAFFLFRWISVKFGFKNRTVSVPLVGLIKESELHRQIEHVRTLRFQDEELDFLRESRFLKIGFFREAFLNFLKLLVLPEVMIINDGQNFRIEVSGCWPEVTLWETIILSIVNELYTQAILKKMSRAERKNVYEEGKKRLTRKIAILKANPDIRFSDFGTRRRWSREWQEYVVSRLVQEVPDQILGTSNVYLAMKLGVAPIGTFAHEMFMSYSGIYRDQLRASHNKVLVDWWEMYGEALSIALTDTYGTDFFFEDMTRDQAEKWRGLRQDSGDPIEFGEKAIKFYESHGIDPRQKLIVFSDGLDIETIVKLTNHFRGRIKVAFGWGTNLTNDMGVKALSLVVKVIEAMQHGTVKLSDNLAKAMGSLKDIELFKKVFGHTVTLNEACTY
jgi:nicotinate phosphoribosyltransferase